MVENCPVPTLVHSSSQGRELRKSSKIAHNMMFARCLRDTSRRPQTSMTKGGWLKVATQLNVRGADEGTKIDPHRFERGV